MDTQDKSKNRHNRFHLPEPNRIKMNLVKTDVNQDQSGVDFENGNPYGSFLSSVYVDEMGPVERFHRRVQILFAVLILLVSNEVQVVIE